MQNNRKKNPSYFLSWLTIPFYIFLKKVGAGLSICLWLKSTKYCLFSQENKHLHNMSSLSSLFQLFFLIILQDHTMIFFLFFPLLPSFFRDVLSNHVLQEGKNILRLNHTIIFTQVKSLCSWLFVCIEVELLNELWAAGSVFIWQGMLSHIMTYRLMAWQILGRE